MAGEEHHDDLVPIRLRMSLGENHIVDTLLWNREDGLAQMQRFSEGFCRDTRIPVSLAPLLVKEIQRQVDAWGAKAQPVRLEPATERLEVIRLDFAVGVTRFTDQFLWDVNNAAASPEEFAMQLGRDLGLEGAITVEVACKLREQLAQRRRQPSPSGGLATALLPSAPSSEELLSMPGGRKRSRSMQLLVEDAAAPSPPAGRGALRSLHQLSCVRAPEQWEEWRPEVRTMGSEEALRYSMEAAQRATEAEAAQARAAAGAAPPPQAAPLDREQQHAEAATLSPAATADGELSVRQLRPRRTARLTELMMASDSPRGTPSAGAPAAVTATPGPATAAHHLSGGKAAALPAAAALASPSGPFVAAVTAAAAAGAPAGAVAGEGAGLSAPGLAALLTSSGGQGHGGGYVHGQPSQLSARQREMLLHRRQLMLQDAAAVGSFVGEPELSGTLSAGFASLLRQQQDSGLFSSQHLPSPSPLLAVQHGPSPSPIFSSQHLPSPSPLLAVQHGPSPSPIFSSQQLPVGPLADMFDPHAAVQHAQRHPQQQEQQQQHELRASASAGMGGGLLEAIGVGGGRGQQQQQQQQQGGGTGLTRGVALSSAAANKLPPAPHQMMPQAPAAGGAGAGGGGAPQKSPYANLFSDMFEDMGVGGIQLEGNSGGQQALLLDGGGSSLGGSDMLSGQLSGFLGLPRGAGSRHPQQSPPQQQQQQQQAPRNGGLGHPNASLGLPPLDGPSGAQQLPHMLGGELDLLSNLGMPLNPLLF